MPCFFFNTSNLSIVLKDKKAIFDSHLMDNVPNVSWESTIHKRTDARTHKHTCTMVFIFYSLTEMLKCWWQKRDLRYCPYTFTSHNTSDRCEVPRSLILTILPMTPCRHWKRLVSPCFNKVVTTTQVTGRTSGSNASMTKLPILSSVDTRVNVLSIPAKVMP